MNFAGNLFSICSDVQRRMQSISDEFKQQQKLVLIVKFFSLALVPMRRDFSLSDFEILNCLHIKK